MSGRGWLGKKGFERVQSQGQLPLYSDQSAVKREQMIEIGILLHTIYLLLQRHRMVIVKSGISLERHFQETEATIFNTRTYPKLANNSFISFLSLPQTTFWLTIFTHTSCLTNVVNYVKLNVKNWNIFISFFSS